MTSMVSTSLIGPDPAVRTGAADQLVTAQLGTDYLPVFDSPSADLQGQIVFVGYGIVDPTQGINDYAGVDVKNCIVLFLRGKPDHYPGPVSHADKIRFARDRGALAYLTATGPILSPYEIRRGATGRPSAFYGQLSLTKPSLAHGSARNWQRLSSPETAMSPILTAFALSKNNSITPHQRDRV